MKTVRSFYSLYQMSFSVCSFSVLFFILFFLIKAGFSSNIDIDETTFITMCVTHVQGLKCELVLDSHFNTVTITGVGHRLWRSNYFSKAAKVLFKRFVQEFDSQDSDNQNLELENRPVMTIGIKHGFPCINICQVSREVLKTEVEDRGF